jgi:hypothetical protein
MSVGHFSTERVRNDLLANVVVQGETSWLISAKHWGETGGTLEDKDKEIWVRMSKFTLMGVARAQFRKWRNVY